MKRINLLLQFICLLFLMVVFLGGCSFDEKKEREFYLGETMDYEDVDIIVTSLSETLVIRENEGYDEEQYDLKVVVTVKNNKTKDFKFKYGDVYVKEKNIGAKYEVNIPANHIGYLLSGDIIISGAAKTYEMSFYSPYSYKTNKFIMMFDWGYLSAEKGYNLFSRDSK